jgi:ABC-type branched-subunit amino acid transport system substrate-binding protein
MSPQQSTGGGGTPAAWTAAIIVIAISLLSSFTLSNPNATSVDAGASETAGTSGDELSYADEATDDYVLAEGESFGVDAEGNRVVLNAKGEVVKKLGKAASGTAGTAGTSSGTKKAGATGGPTGGPTGGGTGNYTCPKNAGATADGVSGNEVKFAATVVRTGIAKSFLADAQHGMEAARVKQNNAGGVCGRMITVKYDDDGWDPYAGGKLIEKYITSKSYFGLAVNPSSEGLRNPIQSGLIKNNQFPVIGADGMLIGQYQDPWVWPVATSTLSTMHVIARDAHSRGARTFGIVWEGNYRFGEEGEKAFTEVIKRLPGASTVANAKIDGGNPSYRNEVDRFIGTCSENGQDLKKCDFIAVLLEPATAAQWVRDGGLGNGTERPRVGIGAPQPLFVTAFARDCGKYCANMRVWTSFKPPLPPFDTEPAVATYANDLKRVSSTADASNPHVEGAYVGMQLVIKALKDCGAVLTRACVAQKLDSTTLETGLAPALKFSPGDHFAAVSAQAFEAIYNVGTFIGWRDVAGDFVTDPEPKADH